MVNIKNKLLGSLSLETIRPMDFKRTEGYRLDPLISKLFVLNSFCPTIILKHIDEAEGSIKVSAFCLC